MVQDAPDASVAPQGVLVAVEMEKSGHAGLGGVPGCRIEKGVAAKFSVLA